jgi:hypothetical protein
MSQASSDIISEYTWPFPNVMTRSGRLNLKRKLLTSAQKHWIGHHIVHGGSSIKLMEFRFNLSHQTLRRYAHQVRRGKAFHDRPGRPFFMSAEEISEFDVILISKGIDVNEISISDLRYELMIYLRTKRLL